MDEIGYLELLKGFELSGETWSLVVASRLLPAWIAAYRAATGWSPELLQVERGALTYLFDAAPTLQQLPAGDDRVVAVWGRSAPPAGRRDARRLAGFIPVPARWSGRGVDRGHLVAHAAGGELDLNLAPQPAALNRGRGAEGRRWSAIERAVAGRPGTPLFVRPVYRDATWAPAGYDYGALLAGALRVERFGSRRDLRGRRRRPAGRAWRAQIRTSRASAGSRARRPWPHSR